MESEHPLAWPVADRTSKESAVAAAHTAAEESRELEALRERIAQLEAENERLSIALRGRGETVHSTLPLRSVNLSDLAEYASTLRTPSK